MYQFEKLNKRIGWIIWAVASLVYVLTIEPTVSFWDCGEFISAGYKLQIGHPPGAPLYLLLARFFSLFSFGNVQIVAYLVNLISAFASSFTILFLFWTVTKLSKKLVRAYIHKSETKQNILIIASGALSALTFTFTDTFWFSAVEGEVYALSSLCTAVVFWAILQWSERASTPYANKWLVLIVFILGLSIGIHLLNILTIPALVLVYYFKKNIPSQKGIFLALVTSLAIVAILMWVIIPGIPALGASVDYLFVNSFGFSPNIGFVIFLIFVCALCIFGIVYSHKANKPKLNLFVLMFSVLLIGYSSYSIIMIRSSANTPMDENNPENPYTLLSYLNRDQYGSSPLVFGQTYNAPVIDYTFNKKVIDYVDGKYQELTSIPEPVYDKNFISFFPRLWSNQPQHIDVYKQWAGIKDGENTVPVYAYGKTFHKPSFWQNLKFFFSYQIGHMYVRYFMWNFSGRQNDIQGHGEPHKGNWITGISFIDSMRLGPQDSLPQTLQENKGHNTYFAIPFMLGILGLIFLWGKSRNDFLITFLLFFFTGIAIVVYLNQYPLQPRERDYAYAGSFYVFSIWIGFGLLWLYQIAAKYFNKKAVTLTLVIAASSPIVLALENWNDHSRSGRYIAHDFSKNYLESCGRNAILFTYGDNDTFPLWYLQEVEGVRTDVRVVNLSLLNTDWYIQQMKKRAYNSAPVPSTLPQEKYRTGVNDEIFVLAHSKLSNVYYPAKDIIDIIASDNIQYKAQQNDGSYVDYIPVPQTLLPVNKNAVIENNIVQENDRARIVDNVYFSLVTRNNQGEIIDSVLPKNKLMMLDMFASNNWERPIYFSTTVGPNTYFEIQNYLFLEGLAYAFKPMVGQANSQDEIEIDVDKMYDNVMHKFEWGNIQNQSVYIDENIANMCMNYRLLFTQLASALINENKIIEAREVLEKCESIFPDNRIPYTYSAIQLGNLYYRIGDDEKAHQVHQKITEHIHEQFLYYMSVKESDKAYIIPEAIEKIATATDLFQIAQSLQNTNDAYFIAQSTTACIESLFPFIKQITICNSNEFQERNNWIYKLSRNNQYVAYWYNSLKQVSQ